MGTLALWCVELSGTLIVVRPKNTGCSTGPLFQRGEGSGGAGNSGGERRVPRGPAAPILTGALLWLLLPAPASSLVSASGPGKGASCKWRREGKCLFFPYRETWTRERLGSRTEGGGLRSCREAKALSTSVCCCIE